MSPDNRNDRKERKCIDCSFLQVKSSRDLKYKDFFDAVDGAPAKTDEQSDGEDDNMEESQDEGEEEMDDEEDDFDGEEEGDDE